MSIEGEHHVRVKNSKFKKSILFFSPDYHCSFFLRDELRKRGWRADIFVPSTYPEAFLFSDADVLREKMKVKLPLSWRTVPRLSLAQFRRVALMCRYSYVIQYGPLGQNTSKDNAFGSVVHWAIRVSLRIVRAMGTRLVYLPNGCRNEASRRLWETIDNGRVCGSCGYADRCNDRVNDANFDLVRKFVDCSVGWDPHITDEYQQTFFRYKSLDLSIYKPQIEIPPELLMESSTNIRVLHSTSLDTRSFEGRNIKGSRYVVDAVNKLKSEQLPVELIRVERITANLMRYVQAQADVVVDQLIYGTFGSTSLECLALGKPVICFIRPSWREFLESRFPEWKDCPIISATPETVYLELKALVVDSNYRAEIAAQSRRFASEFLDVRKNVIEFEDVLLSLR